MKAHFHVKFYESLQADFRKFRAIRHLEEQNPEQLKTVRHHLESARHTVVTIAHTEREKLVLLYCIDTLLTLQQSGNHGKTAAFAVAIDKVPSTFLGKNDLRQCHAAVERFRRLYGEEYFPDWEMYYPYFEADKRTMARKLSRQVLLFSIYVLPILLFLGIILLDYTPIPFLLVLLLLVPPPILVISFASRKVEGESVYYNRKGLFRMVWNEYDLYRFGGAFHRPDCENYTDKAGNNTIEVHFDLYGHDFFIDFDESGVFLLVDEESADPVEERFSYESFNTPEELFAAINQKVDAYATATKEA